MSGEVRTQETAEGATRRSAVGMTAGEIFNETLDALRSCLGEGGWGDPDRIALAIMEITRQRG